MPILRGDTVMKEILVTCKTKDAVIIDKIAEFQGNLKTRDEADIKKIKKSLVKYGITFPFFIWKKGEVIYCLDGHGRRMALMELRADGYVLPPVPVVFVYAKDEGDARQRMLRLNSRYGMITRNSVFQFVGDIEIDFDDLAIPGPANIFFDSAIKDLNDYFNEVPDDEKRKEEAIKICPHCGKVLPRLRGGKGSIRVWR
jgi:hypothetical protein